MSRCDIKILFVIFTLKIFKLNFTLDQNWHWQSNGSVYTVLATQIQVKWSFKIVRWIGPDLGGMKFNLKKLENIIVI